MMTKHPSASFLQRRGEVYMSDGLSPLERYTQRLRAGSAPAERLGGEEPVAPKEVKLTSSTPEKLTDAPFASTGTAATEKPEQTEPEKKETLEEVLADLDKLVGLDELKAHVRTLINLLKIQARQRELGMPPVQVGLSKVFVGNPGTGKTTLARIIARVYGALGRLSKGHLVEVDRQALVGGFVGQTAIKTHEKLEEARGGVLFLDEAYSLVPEGGGGNDFGQEAITTILKFMEDNREDFAFIAAGYPVEMERFLESNSGFASRFDETISFPDYSGDELVDIFTRLSGKHHYRLTQAARTKMTADFTWLVEHKTRNFANGRLVRKYFEELVQRQANRLGKSKKELTLAQLKRVTPADLPQELEKFL
jgi:SpoVK/Ycf46/Vps4 family AAA+-type ATPase